ncbi:hypothetical protein BCR37DRAFT_387822 [Protomyces lactucae-debilis]|uniref:Uncharacterized protein n=1 Tax=Protomyces lactucae-debilis TaxID=2754530 RepID=A0A1Y2FCF9_PROLT|nr:uncharacterized protein BCR37DRAFT_387822 [Protomyces lactucae-debilis]ORY81591.1 hypothetical protein BCR37DRAFT_387822 [Protomyces lactucae-debilis]
MSECRTPERASSPRQNPTPCTPEAPRHRPAQSQALIDAAAINLDNELEGWETLTEARVHSLSDEEARRLGLRASLRQARTSSAHFRFQFELLSQSMDEFDKRQQVEDELVLSEKHMLLARLEQQEAHQAEDEAALFRGRHRKAKRRCLELAEANHRQQFEINHLQAQLLEHRTSAMRFSDNQPARLRQQELGLDVLSNAASALESSQHSNDSHQDALLTRPSTGLMSPAQFPASLHTRPNSSSLSHMRDLDEPLSEKKRKLEGLDYANDADRDTSSEDSPRGRFQPTFAHRPGGMRVADLLSAEDASRPTSGRQSPPTPSRSPKPRRLEPSALL